MIAVIKDKEGKILNIILNVTGIMDSYIITKNNGRIFIKKEWVVEEQPDNPSWKSEEDIKEFITDSFGRVVGSRLKDGLF